MRGTMSNHWPAGGRTVKRRKRRAPTRLPPGAVCGCAPRCPRAVRDHWKTARAGSGRCKNTDVKSCEFAKHTTHEEGWTTPGPGRARRSQRAANHSRPTRHRAGDRRARACWDQASSGSHPKVLSVMTGKECLTEISSQSWGRLRLPQAFGLGNFGDRGGSGGGIQQALACAVPPRGLKPLSQPVWTIKPWHHANPDY